MGPTWIEPHAPLGHFPMCTYQLIYQCFATAFSFARTSPSVSETRQPNNVPRTHSLKKWGCELYGHAIKASQGAERNIFSAELFPYQKKN